QPDSHAAREGRLVAGAAREARADAEVGLPRHNRSENCGQLGRVVLPVAVDLYRDVVAVLEGVAIAGLDGAADTEVEGEAKHMSAAIRGDPGSAVRRAVVDDDDVEAGVESPQLVDHAPDRLFLVQRGH